MKYEVTLEHCPDGSYFAYSDDIDGVMVTGEDRDRVLEEVRTRIHYQLEYCPCSFIKPERLSLDVNEIEGLCRRA